MLDAQGMILERGRIDHLCPEQFVWLVRRWPGCRVVFEACMNWHWLIEILEEVMPREDIVLANPFKTRIIAEAQIKTDKVDARILADLLRANLIAKVHICGKATRDLKEMPSAAHFVASGQQSPRLIPRLCWSRICYFFALSLRTSLS